MPSRTTSAPANACTARWNCARRTRCSTSGCAPPPRTQPSATRLSIFIEFERSPRGEPLSNTSEFIGYLLGIPFCNRAPCQTRFDIACHPSPHRPRDLHVLGVVVRTRAEQQSEHRIMRVPGAMVNLAAFDDKVGVHQRNHLVGRAF